jgi:tRNA pseudouridine-54 N-methylase
MQSIASCHSTNLRIASHCRHLFASRNVQAPQIIGSHMDHRSRCHRDPAVLPLRRTKALQKQTLASSDQNQSASKTPQRNKEEELERNLVRSLEVMSSRERGGEAKDCEIEGDPKFHKSPPHKPKFLTNISIFFLIY